MLTEDQEKRFKAFDQAVTQAAKDDWIMQLFRQRYHDGVITKDECLEARRDRLLDIIISIK
jgi:hypothetical protein